MPDIELAARLIRGGGVLLFPAETVYGLCGAAHRPDVAARIHQIKGSNPAKPLLALTDTWDRVSDWVVAPEPVQRIWSARDLGPITLVLKATHVCPAALMSDGGYVGIRQTTSLWSRELVLQADTPIFSTSANRTGATPPARFEEVDVSIRSAVDMAVDAGEPLAGLPSTVARFDPRRGAFEILRKGPVSADAIQAAASM